MPYGKVDFMVKSELQNRDFDERSDAASEGNGGDAPATDSRRGEEALVGTICPNCGARLEGRKCKLFCPTPGCGYLVTCSEF